MDNLKAHLTNFFYSKWIVWIAVVALAFFVDYCSANAVYYPLECSDHYSGYCNEGSDCYSQFGDDGLNYGGFCFYAPDNPVEFGDELTALEVISDQMEILISGQTFEWNIIGFWLPFSVILNFCITILLAILFKFGYFRKN